MSKPRTAGLPRMVLEAGERRVFMPDFVRTLRRLGLTIHIEAGYGAPAGLTFADFGGGDGSVLECTRAGAFGQDLVFLLRSPRMDDVQLLQRGSCLISMLHYPTRPSRVETLTRLGVRAISLDGIVNDGDERLIENMKAVAWNGLEAAFDVLERDTAERFRSGVDPLRVLILGTGMIGRHAVDAATKMGRFERNAHYMRDGGPGVTAISIGRNVTSNAAAVEPLFRQADMLVDATQRLNPSRPVVPNAWISWLPEHAVITDLAVDPYKLDASPPVVRGVEGIPQGDLDQQVYRAGDAGWDRSVPSTIPSGHRRTVVSCYSWPGIHPEACMAHYARQLEPLLEPLVQKGCDGLSPHGGFFERALYRATLRGWIAAHPPGERGP